MPLEVLQRNVILSRFLVLDAGSDPSIDPPLVLGLWGMFSGPSRLRFCVRCGIPILSDSLMAIHAVVVEQVIQPIILDQIHPTLVV